MDVVKTNVEKIGGTVDVQSKARRRHDGQDENSAHSRDYSRADGEERGDRYAIPQVSLLEFVRLEGEETTTRSNGCRER